MARHTGIAWTDATQNFYRGCTAVSEACKRCYARTQIERQTKGRIVWGKRGQRVRTGDAVWKQPQKWNREAMKAGRRIRVFCSSLSDMFDNHPSILSEWRIEIWNIIRETPWLDWQILTKRPQNIKRYLPSDWGDGWPHVWLGCTVENQVCADNRIPKLLSVPAVVRFLSCEPLLGPLNLTEDGRDYLGPNKVNWLICGGENAKKGTGVRPMMPAWATSLRDQCQNAQIPFFFKQWGNFNENGQEVGTVAAGTLLQGIKYHNWPNPPEAAHQRANEWKVAVLAATLPKDNRRPVLPIVNDATVPTPKTGKVRRVTTTEPGHGNPLEGRIPQRKRGRPPKSERTMTDAERSAAYRARKSMSALTDVDKEAIEKTATTFRELANGDAKKLDELRRLITKALK